MLPTRTQHPLPPSRVDMLSPQQTCRALHIDERALLAMVNDGQLAAYRLGGVIRFRAGDVGALGVLAVA